MGSWKIKKANWGTDRRVYYKQKSFLGGWVRNNRPLCSTIALGCAMLVASPAWATTVEPGYGDLTINQGRGFNPVTSRINANVGDSVMVGASGAATVTYDDGCKVSVQPGAVTTIAPLSPCAAGSNAATTGTSYYPNCTPQPDGSQYCHPDWALIAVAVGAAAVLGVGIWAVTSTHGSTGPASP
jgi:hypothetical protein